MTVVFVVCGVLLTAAVVLVMRRVEVGPSILDRVVALDVIVSTFLAAVALYAAWTDRRDLVPAMIALSIVGFVGAVSVARFVAAESDDEGRILSAGEIPAPRRGSVRDRGHPPATAPGDVDAGEGS